MIHLIYLGQLFCQDFTAVTQSFVNLQRSAMSWGDYDNDGDLDIVVTGFTGLNYVSEVYRNDEGSFTDTDAGLDLMAYGSAEWGDYDNDGDLDILLTGFDDDGEYHTDLYRNDTGTFNNVNTAMPGVLYGTAKWGDYDNDGDLDIFLTGNASTVFIARIYRNDSGVFTDINAGFPGVQYSSMNWCDYDNDGDLDVLYSGNNGPSQVTYLYNNNNGIFYSLSSGLPGVHFGPIECGDYNSDGYADIFICGFDGSGWIAEVYRNNGGSFSKINEDFEGVASGDAQWGDYDNDGDLDLMYCGQSDQGFYSKVYRNDGGSFTDIEVPFVNVRWSAMNWGDYDNDGDLDVFLSGNDGSTSHTVLYRNNSSVLNNKPSAPYDLSSLVYGSSAILSWNRSNDNETAQNGLKYNIYIGTFPATDDKMTSMSNIQSGYRKIVCSGNSGSVNNFSIKDLEYGATYYWGVQAVDNTYAGSYFSLESSFFVDLPDPPSAPAALPATDIGPGSFTANWQNTASTNGYILEVSVDSLFGSFVTGYEALDVDDVTSFSISGLTGSTDYFYRIRAYNEGGGSGYSNIISLTTDEQSGNALSLDGSNDYVNFSSTAPSATTTQTITVEAWIYPVVNTNARVIASKYYGGSSSSSNFMFARDSNQKILVVGNGTNSFLSNGTVPINQWTHVAVVFKSGTNNTKIYISGVLDKSETLNYSASNSTTNMRIGDFVNIISYPVYQKWNGAVDDLRLWNRELTGKEIADHMNIPLSGSESGLIAYYGFDQGVANGINTGITTLNDLTGHGYNGTLYNFALTGTISNWVEGILNSSQLSTPINLSITSSGNESILNWDLVLHADSYSVYSSIDPYVSFPDFWTIEAVGVTDTTWIDTDVNASIKFYTVVAVRN